MSQQQHRKKGLDQFLRLQLFRERSSPLEKFVLKHAASGSRGVEVDEFPVTTTITIDQVPILVDDIMVRAQSYADGLGTKTQRFSVEALSEGARSGPRFAISVRGEGEEDGEDGEEAPTEKGLTTQLMRHNEALMRMLVMTTGTSVQHLQRQLESAGNTIKELVQESNSARKAVEVANTDQHERDMQMMLTSGAEDRKNAMFKKFESLLPILFKKLSGDKMLTDNEQSMVSSLVSTLSEDQLRSIAGTLSPEQQMIFFTLYKEAKAASEKQSGPTS